MAWILPLPQPAPLPFQRAVQIGRAALRGGNGVADAQAQVVVRMYANRAVHHGLNRLHAITDLLRSHGAGGVRHINHVGAILTRHLRLLSQDLRRRHMAHHKEADGLQAQLFAQHDVLLAGSHLRAVNRHADDIQALVHRHAQVVHRAKSGHQQCGQLGVFNTLRAEESITLSVSLAKPYSRMEPPMPPPWPTSGGIDAALFQARADIRMFWALYWWETAWLPSRSVVSIRRMEDFSWLIFRTLLSA